MKAYTAVFGLSTAADADHAGQLLDYLADYHPAITRTDSGRAELTLTLPADDLHHFQDREGALRPGCTALAASRAPTSRSGARCCR